VRIILRTGQPGQAPERAVIVDYDINDYKAKTELTADKLFTSVTAALRGYQQLERLEATRRGLEIIVDAASMLFDLRSVRKLAQGVLTQIATLLGVDCARHPRPARERAGGGSRRARRLRLLPRPFRRRRRRAQRGAQDLRPRRAGAARPRLRGRAHRPSTRAPAAVARWSS
jgi:hypothetical protein